VFKVVGEQRSNGSVDEPGRQGFLLAGTALTLEKATGDLTGCIGFFLIIDCQRKEVLAFFCLFGAHNSTKYRGTTHTAHDCTCCLTSNTARLKSYRLVTVLK